MLAVVALSSVGATAFSGEPPDSWEPSRVGLEFPMSVSFSADYLYFSFGVGMRIKSVADLYLHPGISFAMENETLYVTEEFSGKPERRLVTEDSTMPAFRLALEYTVFKYTAVREVGPFRYLRHLNRRVRVSGDLGPVVGATYANGIVLDAGLNWRDGGYAWTLCGQYNLSKNRAGVFTSLGVAF